jgi:DNA-binding LacI/PurR family transcriptional regulator
MANIKMIDIAKAANVSLATVGRVIHNNGYVSETKRKEIKQTIKDMGYVPNKMAQAFKYSQSKLMGHMTLFNQNMLYEQISAAVDKAAVSHGYHVLTLACHANQGEEAKQVEELIGQRVEGIIITSNSMIDRELITKLVDNKIPVVMIERTLDIPYVDRVMVDDLEGAYNAVTHILQNGHRLIGFIGEDLEHEVEINRYNGYCKAVSDHGIPILPELIQLKPDYSIPSGYKATKALMEGTNPPTAIFVTSDIYACGVMQYLYEKNIRVPYDISIVGYDNTLSTMLAPAVNSVGLPYQEIGDWAIKLLLSRMENEKSAAQTVIINTRYIDRGTVLEFRK